MERNFNFYYRCPELQEAICKGFQHDFILTPAGQLYCLDNPARLYDLEDVVVTFASCSIPATIYLISTKDGRYAGTLIDYWETFSTD